MKKLIILIVAISDYMLNAKNVLFSMGVKFSCTFIDYNYFWEDDKQCRNIYKITFSRGGKRFSIKFGQSVSSSEKDIQPTEYDVLACIQKNDVGNFENFCSEFGYDEDSRKAEKTYKAVCKEFKKVSKFFTSEELETLQEIQ